MARQLLSSEIELPVPNLSGLTEEEQQQLLLVMQRAKQFEEEEKQWMKQTFEGQLTKFTNVMKGWLPRWFVLNPQTGMLEYFEKEEHKKQRPRGTIFLIGAVVCPSDEDSQTFSVHANNGEIFRIRAQDAKSRQHWVDRLRATAEHHTASFSKKRSFSGSSDTIVGPLHVDALTSRKSSDISTAPSLHRPASSTKYRHHNLPDALRFVKEHQLVAEDLCTTLHCQINELGSSGYLHRYDHDLLVLKATCSATIRCINQCFVTLQQQQMADSKAGYHSSAPIRWFEPKPPLPLSLIQPLPELDVTNAKSDAASCSEQESHKAEVLPDRESEVEDTELYLDSDLGHIDKYKTLILGLLSKLKLGMDLTKVTLPTFILEKRSLLEMFADCMAHPHLFLRISEYDDPESRMIGFLRWYLSTFHAGRQGSLAKKPYNPIIGETFHCSWRVRDVDVSSEDVVDNLDCNRCSIDDDDGGENGTYQLTYCAEQVSHHPPISALYCACLEKGMSLNAAVWTKSKFLGMSVALELIGPLTLKLEPLGEHYTFTLPSVYARSILTTPWVEMGEKLNITCPQTGYSASVTFHTKPFYGGRLHRVTGEVKDTKGGGIVCRIQGEWDSTYEFVYTSGRRDTLDVSKLSVFKKHVRPLNLQSEYESRKLWQHVTHSLSVCDYDSAMQHKHFLEERQRYDERLRKEKSLEFSAKFFHKVGDTWLFKTDI